MRHLKENTQNALRAGKFDEAPQLDAQGQVTKGHQRMLQPDISNRWQGNCGRDFTRGFGCAAFKIAQKNHYRLAVNACLDF